MENLIRAVVLTLGKGQVEAFITGDFNFESPSQLKMVALGNELGDVRNQIIKQMRSELGYKS